MFINRELYPNMIAPAAKHSFDELKILSQESFSQARAFLKNGIKSTNKVYLTADKKRKFSTRNKNALCFDRTEVVDDKRGMMFTAKKIVDENKTDINCGYMGFVGAHFFYKNTKRPTELRRYSAEPKNEKVDGTFDHEIFVYGNELPDHVNSINDMRQLPYTHSMTIDVWAGIVCPTREYPDKIKEKAAKWDMQSKFLVNSYNSGKPVFEAASIVLKNLADYPLHLYGGNTFTPEYYGLASSGPA